MTTCRRDGEYRIHEFDPGTVRRLAVELLQAFARDPQAAQIADLDMYLPDIHDLAPTGQERNDLADAIYEACGRAIITIPHHDPRGELTMSTYTDMTAAQLAAELDQIQHIPAANVPTGWVSMLDEATLAYWSTMPEAPVAEAQRAFAAARYIHLHSYTTERGDHDPMKWMKLQDAARNLAAELRTLGDHRIARCTAETGWGTCNLPLRAGGTCSAAEREHITLKEG